MFRGVSVLVDAMDPQKGVLAHANEWALRLTLPLRIAEANLDGRRRPAFWYESPSVPSNQFFRPFDLCVYGACLPAPLKETLYLRALRCPQASVMICPSTWRPSPRVLILNQHRRPGACFLETAAAVCRAFQVTPILLTTARTDVDARSRERVVEEAIARRGLTVDCDIVTGCDVPTAVAQAARWRRCSHVLLERRIPSFLRRWLFGDMLRELAGLSASPALVALSATPPSDDRLNESIPVPGSADAAVRPV